MKTAGHYLRMIHISSAMQASTPFSMYVIPGKDHGPHARDKHQTRLKGRRVERASRLQCRISLLDPWSLPGMTARKAAVYESCRAFPEYDKHNISHAGEYTFLNVRHPWQGPGNSCQRQVPNLTQRTASRASFTTAMLFLTFRSLVTARNDGPKGTVYESRRALPAYD